MPTFNYWRQDLQSSLVVFLVALPLCLGIALASNAPLSSGLLAGIIGGIVVGFFGGSNLSVSGPAAGLTVIVINALTTLGDFQTFTLAVFLSGLFQIAFGLLRGGVIGNFFPSSVIKGMLAAIGLILILKQVPHAVGYDADFMGDEAFMENSGENTFTSFFKAFQAFHVGAIIISIVSFFVIVGFDKFTSKYPRIKFIPSALVAVVVAVGMNELLKQFAPGIMIDTSHLVQLPFKGGVAEFLDGIRAPNWGALSNPKVYLVALTIAVIGSLESLLSINAADKMDTSGDITSKNRELFAQGLGNSISGLVGGLPITAVIVRTTANFSSGAKSKLSAILHGFWLLICVITIPKILNLIPLSVLAVVLILVGFKLTQPALIKSMWKKGMNQFIPFAVTIMAILFTDLLIGIGIGLAVGFFFVMRANIKKSIVMVKDDQKNFYLLRFHKDVSFLQKVALMKHLDDIKPDSTVMIEASNGVFIDDDIVDLIEDFSKVASRKNIQVTIKRSTLSVSKFFQESYSA